MTSRDARRLVVGFASIAMLCTSPASAENDVRSEIESVLQQLIPEFRAAVVLVDLQGMSLEQASDTLDVPTGTIKSRLFRARKQLAQSLGNLKPPSEHPNGDTGET